MSGCCEISGAVGEVKEGQSETGNMCSEMSPLCQNRRHSAGGKVDNSGAVHFQISPPFFNVYLLCVGESESIGNILF